jgi:hypothetical protein
MRSIDVVRFLWLACIIASLVLSVMRAKTMDIVAIMTNAAFESIFTYALLLFLLYLYESFE